MRSIGQVSRGRIGRIPLDQNDNNWTLIPNGTNTSFVKYGLQVNTTGSTTRIANLITNENIKCFVSAKPFWGGAPGGVTQDGTIERTANNYTWTGARLTDYEAFVNASLGSAESICGYIFPGHDLHPSEFGYDDVLTPPTHYIAAAQFMASHLGTKVNKYQIWNETVASVQNQLNSIYNASVGIKAGNPAAKIGGPSGLDPNPAIPATLTDFLAATCSNGATWKDCMDAYAFHQYGGLPNSAAKTPENMWARNRNVISTVQTDRPGCPIWLTETAWNNASTNAITQALTADYLSRYLFLLRCHPFIEIVSYFQDWSDTVFDWGLYTTGGGARKTQGDVWAAAVPILHHTTSAKFYQHNSANVLAVALRMDDGTNRLMLYGNTWKTTTGANDGADASTTALVTADTGATGNLSVQVMGSVPSSSGLGNGKNDLSIPVTARALVVSADTPVSFRGLSPV